MQHVRRAVPQAAHEEQGTIPRRQPDQNELHCEAQGLHEQDELSRDLQQRKEQLLYGANEGIPHPEFEIAGDL